MSAERLTRNEENYEWIMNEQWTESINQSKKSISQSRRKARFEKELFSLGISSKFQASLGQQSLEPFDRPHSSTEIQNITVETGNSTYIS